MILCNRSKVPVGDLLKEHRQQQLSNDSEDIYRVHVRRNKILEDSLSCFRKGIPFPKNPRITFIGEPAVDAGGPLHEFFHLLVSAIAHNSNLFKGKQNCLVPSNSIVEFEKKTYLYIGQMLALSIIHGGRSPSFFSQAIADFFVYGLDAVEATPADVPEPVISTLLEQVIEP